VTHCTLNTFFCLLPLPAMIVLELFTRDSAFRSFSILVMAALLISIPIISLGAVIMFCVRYRQASSVTNGWSFRHLLSPALVLCVHGIYFVGFLLSPWPVAIRGM